MNTISRAILLIIIGVMGIPVFIVFMIMAYSMFSPSQSSKSTKEGHQENHVTTQHVLIPNYSVINRGDLGNLKCSMDIRLDKRVSEGQLRLLAKELKSNLGKKHERIFIV